MKPVREDEYRERIAQLERQVEELRQANAELARACAFTSDCCHELKAPLATIIAYAELLQAEAGGGLTRQQREYVEGIMEAGQELLNSMNDILDLARLEAGRMEVRLQQVAVPEVVDALVRRVLPRIQMSGLSLEVNMPDLPPVEADRAKTERVLFNILDNAIKFTPAGGKIQVYGRLMAKTGEVVVSVRDTGPGIPKAEQEAIFDRFYRAREQGDGTGAGLGLTLARELVEMQGGRIWVISEPGAGSEFSVAFPISRRGEVSR